MHRPSNLLRLTWLLLSLALPLVSADARPTTPKAGDPLRKAILEALREPVRKELKQPVVFRVDELKVERDWAFLLGRPQQPDGKPIDYRRTRYREAVADGVFDDGICALLRKQKGRWRVVTYVIGATDVPYADWARRYKAPSSLFD